MWLHVVYIHPLLPGENNPCTTTTRTELHSKSKSLLDFATLCNHWFQSLVSHSQCLFLISKGNPAQNLNIKHYLNMTHHVRLLLIMQAALVWTMSSSFSVSLVPHKNSLEAWEIKGQSFWQGNKLKPHPLYAHLQRQQWLWMHLRSGGAVIELHNCLMVRFMRLHCESVQPKGSEFQTITHRVK